MDQRVARQFLIGSGEPALDRPAILVQAPCGNESVTAVITASGNEQGGGVDELMGVG